MKIICIQNDAVKLVIITNSSLWGSVLAYSCVTFKVHFTQTIQCWFCTVTDHPVISVSAGNGSNRCKLTPDRRRCDVTEGEAVNIRCNSHSNPDPASTRWYKGHPGSSPAGGAGIAQWLEHRTRDWKVAGSNPCWNGGRIFFSRVDFLCWLLFRYPFHPRVTAVARKKSRSFCQKVQVAGYS